MNMMEASLKQKSAEQVSADNRMTELAIVDLKQKWQRVAQRLRAELGDDLFTSWFGRMDAEDHSNLRLIVSVPTRFLKSWIENHYVTKLQKIAEVEFGRLDSILVRVRGQIAPQRAAEVVERAVEPQRHGQNDPQTGPAASMNFLAQGDRNTQLDLTQTFDSFVVGTSNQLAHAAACRVTEAMAGAPVTFNPLFIHSASGLGKTHLLNAVAHRIREIHPERKVLFLTAERFMYSFIQALRQRDTISFKDQFQSVDVLLIDDFQFLQGKTMQQEFCHTFNSLVDSRRQVIVAADVPPSQLDTIDQRMRSRLIGGLVIDIEMPDLELRRKIVLSRYIAMNQRDHSIVIPDDVLEFVANRITGGGRELEGALNRVVAYQQFNKAPITLDLASMVLRDMSANPDQCRIKIDDILKIVGRHFNVARTDLLSPRRARSIVVPRQVGMYLAKKMTSRSLPEIGRRFGGRDHSTVLHAVRKIDDQIKTDDRLAKEVALLIRLVEQQ
jgi:chromosomal replication initiator protein